LLRGDLEKPNPRNTKPPPKARAGCPGKAGEGSILAD
jgi:hypothetical protein